MGHVPPHMGCHRTVVATRERSLIIGDKGNSSFLVSLKYYKPRINAVRAAAKNTVTHMHFPAHVQTMVLSKTNWCSRVSNVGQYRARAHAESLPWQLMIDPTHF